MNFLKNTYNKLFAQNSSESSTSQQQSLNTGTADIPQDALTDMFGKTI